MPDTGRRYEHRYQEPEAALILQRAADLQRQALDARRMTLAELEDAAGSAGIEAIHVRRAATELSLRMAQRHRSSPLLGGPRTILFEIVIEGEIPVRAYEYVIEAVRRHTGELGVASLIGRSLTWMALPSHSSAGARWARTISLTIVPRGGRTQIRLEEKLDQLVQALFGSLAGGLGGGGTLVPLVSLAVVGAPGLIPLGMGLWFTGIWMLARRAYSQRVADRERELDHALQAIIEIAEEYRQNR